MFVIVAENTEVFPITAVSGIIVVIAVLMVNGQQMQSGELNLASAFGADPTVQFERALAVVTGGIRLGAHPSDSGVNFFLTLGRLRPFVTRAKGSHGKFLWS